MTTFFVAANVCFQELAIFGAWLETHNGFIMDYRLIERLMLGIAARLRPLSEIPANTVYVDGKKYCWHGSASAQENGCAVLWHLQVATVALFKSKETWTSGVTFATWRDIVGKKEIAGFPQYFHVPNEPDCIDALAKADQDDWPELQEILAAYIELETHGGSPYLPTDRNAYFSLELKRHEAELDELVRTGFAQRKGNKYCWTEKMAPVMTSIFYWDR